MAKPNPWLDAVHYLGLTGALVAIAAFAIGCILYFGFELRGEKYGDPRRRRLRLAHLLCGFVGGGLAMAHYVGRQIQAGHWGFGFSPPFLAGYGFALLLISGALRYWTPRAWRSRWRVFAWLHRLGILVALSMLTVHSWYQIKHHTMPGHSQ